MLPLITEDSVPSRLCSYLISSSEINPHFHLCYTYSNTFLGSAYKCVILPYLLRCYLLTVKPSSVCLCTLGWCFVHMFTTRFRRSFLFVCLFLWLQAAHIWSESVFLVAGWQGSGRLYQTSLLFSQGWWESLGLSLRRWNHPPFPLL